MEPLTDADLAAIAHGHADCRSGYCCCWPWDWAAGEPPPGGACDVLRLVGEVRRLSRGLQRIHREFHTAPSANAILLGTAKILDEVLDV